MHWDVRLVLRRQVVAAVGTAGGLAAKRTAPAPRGPPGQGRGVTAAGGPCAAGPCKVGRGGVDNTSSAQFASLSDGKAVTIPSLDLQLVAYKRSSSVKFI